MKSLFLKYDVAWKHGVVLKAEADLKPGVCMKKGVYKPPVIVRSLFVLEVS